MYSMYVRKNKRMRKRPYSSYKKGKSLATRITRLARKVDGEKKYYDVRGFVDVTNSPTQPPYHLTSIPSILATSLGIVVGNAVNTRVGNRIKVPYIQYNCNFDLPTSNGFSNIPSTIRQLVVMDLLQVSDASPLMSDLLETPSINSFYNGLKIGRFKVLQDKCINMDNAQKMVRNIKGNIRVNKIVQYNTLTQSSSPASNTGNDIQKNGIYVFWISDYSGTEFIPRVNFNFRVKFYDN